MDEARFPSNSRNGKAAEEPKKIERIATGGVTRRKPSAGRRFRDLVVGGDATSVGQYILFDILLPAIKDTIADMVSQGVERMLFGEGRSTSRRTGSRPGGSTSYVNYNRASSGPPWRREDRRDDRQRPRPRSNHNFDDIILSTRAEAEDVISTMFDIVEKYNEVTVSDVCEMVGITPAYTDEKWGWTDIRHIGITRVRDGYLLDLGRPEPLV